MDHDKIKAVLLQLKSRYSAKGDPLIEKSIDLIEALRIECDNQHTRILDLQDLSQDWQPIETAPKDRKILICGLSRSGYYVADVKWNEEEDQFCLFHPDDDAYTEPTYYPKYWMPLPKAPDGTGD